MRPGDSVSGQLKPKYMSGSLVASDTSDIDGPVERVSPAPQVHL